MSLPARRAAAACQPCHRRKTKCDVLICGSPCSACITDGRSSNECFVVTSKRTKTKHKIPTRPHHLQSPMRAQPDALESGSVSSSHTSPSNRLEESQVQQEDPSQSLSTQKTTASLTQHQSRRCSHPMYIGDTLDDNLSISLVLTASSGAPTNHHTIVPQTKANSLCPEDITYLIAKGALNLPPVDVCEDLVRCYFLNVHLWLPVINPKDFLSKYTDGGPQAINLMLLWVVLLAGSHFASEETISNAGFTSRLDMELSYFTRAKKLYDVNYLDDKEVCAQALVLMIFWYPCQNKNCSGPQSLLGIAINLCQCLMSEFNSTVRQDKSRSSSQKTVWARIWWACVLYDGWTSLTAGRCSKTNHYIDRVPIPLSDDIMQELEALPSSIRQQYVPQQSDRLAEYYIRHLEIASFLGKILAEAAKPDGSNDFNCWENDIKSIDRATSKMVAEDTRSANEPLKIAAYHFQVCYAGAYVSMLGLHKMSSPQPLEGRAEESRHQQGHEELSAAARRVISILETMVSLDIPLYHRQGVFAALVPVTQFYLFQMASKSELRRKVAQKMVDTCILIMEEMQKTCWAAQSFARIFKWASERVLASEAPTSPVTAGDSASVETGGTCDPFGDLDMCLEFQTGFGQFDEGFTFDNVFDFDSFF